MYNPQDFANETNAVKKIDLPKVINKKRGRACTRREKRNTTSENRIMHDRLAASFFNKEYLREKKQFEKLIHDAGIKGSDNVTMPIQLKELRDTAKMHEANLVMANISHEVMKKFPPLHA